MVFSSPVFLFLFLPLTLLAVWLIGRRGQNTVLLLASLLFYAWGEGAYVLLMLATVLVNHLCGLAIDRGVRPRLWVGIAVALNLATLVAFKYANFLVDSFNAVTVGFGLAPVELAPVHLPIGISFFIFQGMSYAIDVYRRTAEVQLRPGPLALYISLFPQLIAGPIVRYQDVARQIADRSTTLPGFTSGVRRFIVGLAKKVLIADHCARIADGVFAVPPDALPMATAWLGTVAYAVQIYFDFSGYSDMAIGLGRMLGFEFLENFDRPYIARSLREFWRRWHISLSTWFRDYLYIPLGGSRLGTGRTYLNLFVVFLLTGLWHGASWNFVVWGLVHGLFLVLERAGLGRLLERAPRLLGHLYTLAVVLVAWVFFRITDLTEAWHTVLAMVGAIPGDPVINPPALFVTNTTLLALAIGVLGALNVHVTLGRLLGLRRTEPHFPTGLRGTFEAAGLLLLFLGVAMAVASTTYSPFIYFRF